MKIIDDTKYYSEEEFNQFDWSALEHGEYATNGKNYNFGEGGSGYPAGRGHNISVFTYDTTGKALRESVWELPKPISRYMDWLRRDGADTKVREIRRVLDIDDQ